MTEHEFVCVKCGEHKTRVNDKGFGGGTGYATTDEGKVCYECCAEIDRAWMREHGKITLYLADRKVTNWPGTLTFPVRERREGQHNIAQTRTDVWFTGPDGAEWWGVGYGQNTDIVHCRRKGAR